MQAPGRLAVLIATALVGLSLGGRADPIEPRAVDLPKPTEGHLVHAPLFDVDPLPVSRSLPCGTSRTRKHEPWPCCLFRRRAPAASSICSLGRSVGEQLTRFRSRRRVQLPAGPGRCEQYARRPHMFRRLEAHGWILPQLSLKPSTPRSVAPACSCSAGRHVDDSMARTDPGLCASRSGYPCLAC
jgi:hypothetical protein